MSSTTQSFKENYSSAQQPAKNIDSSRKHQTKKQVFGEIKNVIHNQGIVTPLKLEQMQPKNASPKFISPANLKLKQQNRNDYKPNRNLKTQRSTLAYNCEFEDFHLLDEFDFRGKCCLKTGKSDQQIWSEMNLYSDAFLDNIFDVKKLDQMEDIYYADFKKEEYEKDSQFSDDERDESNFSFWPDTKGSQDEANLQLIFEKPPIFDFNF